jgi:putative ABC transport system substrate-binding protein
MTYNADLARTTARAGDIAARILKGTKPGEIPVEQATNYELVINLKTAKALAITVPQSILIRADLVIE